MQEIQTDQTHRSVEAPREQKQSVLLREATLNRLDQLREDGQTYDELITELINIYETVEWSLAYGGDTL